MAFKKQHATYPAKKQYFWRMAEFGNGVSMFGYVAADTVLVMSMSDYFTVGDDAELTGSGASEGGSATGSTERKGAFKPGDLLLYYQVAAISDDRTIQQDIAAGLADVSLHVVLNAASTVVNLSEDLLGATVTYTS